VELTADLKLSNEARTLLRPEMTVVEYFDVLVKGRLFPDAVRVISRAMTPKEAVWWGCLCIWSTARPQASPKVETAVRAAVKWLREPTDEHRRAAGAAATSAGDTTPAGMIAMAAFFAEGSVAPVGQPKVQADPHTSGTLVAEAVLAISRTAGPEPAGGPLVRQFLAIAVEVFRGANLPK
jgi:hypothetical protein